MRRRLLVLLVIVSTIGGCGLLTDDIDPADPGRPEVRQRAGEARPVVQGLLTGARGDGSPLAVAEKDECEAGQHNWKVDTGWDWRCTLSGAVVVDGGEVEDGLRRQQQLAEAAGCTSYHNRTQDQVEDADWLIEDYWRDLRDRPGYTASDLPRLRYDCPGDVRLEVISTDDAEPDPLPATWQNPAPVLASTPEGVDGSRQYFTWTRPTDAEIDRLQREQADSPLTLVLIASTDYHVR